MPLTPDRRLQARIVGALAFVVGVNALILSVVGLSLYWAWETTGRSGTVDSTLPVSAGSLAVTLVVVGAAALVVAQARYGSHRVVADLELESIEGDGPRNVGGRVGRLATQAGVTLPSVAVADHEEPACLTVGTQRSPTVVLTRGLLEELDDAELEAALAHEIAHLANRDLTVVSAVAAVVGIGDRLLERERALRKALIGLVTVAVFTGLGIIVFAIPIVLVGIVYVLFSAVARLVLGLNAIALGLFSRTREYAADRGASRLTGNPAALASALETLEEVRPERDARLDASATLGIVPLSLSTSSDSADDDHWLDRWVLDQFSALPTRVYEDQTDASNDLKWILGRLTWLIGGLTSPFRERVSRVFAWRPSTHPSNEARIEQLSALERRRLK